MSSFSGELHWWQTADDSACRGVDNWDRVCTTCVVTEVCGHHTVVLTQGW